MNDEPQRNSAKAKLEWLKGNASAMIVEVRALRDEQTPKMGPGYHEQANLASTSLHFLISHLTKLMVMHEEQGEADEPQQWV